MVYNFITALDKYDQRIFGSIDLQQCKYDGFRMHGLWLGQGQMYRLLDDACTYSNLIDTLTGLAKQANPGDVVRWFHSGHGTYHDQIGSLSTRRATGRVLYNAVLWDSELLPVWQQFKKGVTIIAISDTCYSESNNRFAQVPSHGPAAIAYRERYVALSDLPANMLNHPVYATSDTRAIKASMVELSACSFLQTAKEVADNSTYPRGGVFTTALLQAVQTKWDITLADITKVCRKLIPPAFNQTPQVAWVKATPTIKKMVFKNP